MPLLTILAVVGCQEATELSLVLRTDAPCDGAGREEAVVRGAGVALGLLEEAAVDPVADEPNCQPTAGGGEFGDLTVVPGPEMRDFRIQVGVALGEASPTACSLACGSGCIRASRRGSFVERASLTLPIEVQLSCIDVCCDAGDTCFQGYCIPEDSFTGCENPPCEEPPPFPGLDFSYALPGPTDVTLHGAQSDGTGVSLVGSYTGPGFQPTGAQPFAPAPDGQRAGFYLQAGRDGVEFAFICGAPGHDVAITQLSVGADAEMMLIESDAPAIDCVEPLDPAATWSAEMHAGYALAVRRNGSWIYRSRFGEPPSKMPGGGDLTVSAIGAGVVDGQGLFMLAGFVSGESWVLPELRVPTAVEPVVGGAGTAMWIARFHTSNLDGTDPDSAPVFLRARSFFIQQEQGAGPTLHEAAWAFPFDERVSLALRADGKFSPVVSEVDTLPGATDQLYLWSFELDPPTPNQSDPSEAWEMDPLQPWLRPAARPREIASVRGRWLALREPGIGDLVYDVVEPASVDGLVELAENGPSGQTRFEPSFAELDIGVAAWACRLDQNLGGDLFACKEVKNDVTQNIPIDAGFRHIAFDLAPQGSDEVRLQVAGVLEPGATTVWDPTLQGNGTDPLLVIAGLRMQP